MARDGGSRTMLLLGGNNRVTLAVEANMVYLIVHIFAKGSGKAGEVEASAVTSVFK